VDIEIAGSTVPLEGCHHVPNPPVAAAMTDRIVHHVDVLPLRGSSYRLEDTGIDTLPSASADNTAQ